MRHRACRARSQRRSVRSPGNADAPNRCSHIAKSRVKRCVGCGPGYPGVGPGRVPLIRSNPCAPRKPSSSTSSGSPPSSRIPVNQRRYAWTRRHCRQLWDDILDAGERQGVREHFLGPVMYVAAVDPLNAHWAPCLVYDGQQRLSTVTLILKVLSRHLKDDTAPDGFGPDQIRSEYLVNPFGKGDQHYRLVLKAGDAETLLALIHDRAPCRPSLHHASWMPSRSSRNASSRSARTSRRCARACASSASSPYRGASSPAVYASRRALPHAMQDSLPAGGLRLCRAGVEPAGSLREVSAHVILLSRAYPGAINVPSGRGIVRLAAEFAARR